MMHCNKSMTSYSQDHPFPRLYERCVVCGEETELDPVSEKAISDKRPKVVYTETEEDVPKRKRRTKKQMKRAQEKKELVLTEGNNDESESIGNDFEVERPGNESFDRQNV